MRGWTYILECVDGTYYVGSTNDIERRMKEHQSGLGGIYTSARLPVKLKAKFEFETIHEAFRFEHQIKKWSRAKKEALMEGRYNDLHILAKKNFRNRK